jgi:hypothetical protein
MRRREHREADPMHADEVGTTCALVHAVLADRFRVGRPAPAGTS